MDLKEQALLKYYYDKFIDNCFDEKDVYTFLLLIRNRNKEIHCINELADFVAQRGQYNGYIKDYLFETRKKFENLGKTKTAIRIEDVYSFKELKKGINQAFAAFQIAGLTNERLNDIVVCLISLLQQINIIDENERKIGKLFFAVSTKQLILMAEIEVSQNLIKKTNAVFPVLTANNCYIDIKKQDRFDTPYLFADKVIEILNQNGKLEIGGCHDSLIKR